MNRLLHGRFTNPDQPAIRETSATLSGNLFVFLDRADVEATNYPKGDQDIRIAVVNRKTCDGGNSYRERGTGPVDPHERPAESCRHNTDPRDRHRHVNPSCSRQYPRLGQPRAVNKLRSLGNRKSEMVSRAKRSNGVRIYRPALLIAGIAVAAIGATGSFGSLWASRTMQLLPATAIGTVIEFFVPLFPIFLMAFGAFLIAKSWQR